IADRLEAAVSALEEATLWMIAAMKTSRETALSGASAYLRLAGDTAGGYYLACAALEARGQPDARQALALARFFAEDTLSRAPGNAAAVSSAAEALRESPSLWG